MRNLEYIVRSRWRNNQNWRERKYNIKLKIHLKNLEKHIHNTKVLNLEIEYFTNTTETIEQYLVYLEQKILDTKRYIRGSENRLKYFEQSAKIKTAIG